VGIDGELWQGGGTEGGAFAQRATGFSGKPLSFVGYRPENSGDTWVYIADTVQMKKASVDTILDIGLVAPAAALSSVIASDLQTVIDSFEGVVWQENEVDAAEGTADAAVATTDRKQGGTSGLFETSAVETEGYVCFWNKALELDLSVVGADEAEASDDDHFHLWMKIDQPKFCKEIRLYFVCSETFETDTVPGTDETKNCDAYMKIFRPATTTALIELVDFARAVANDVISLRHTEDNL